MGVSLVDDAMSYLYNVCIRKCEQSIFYIYMISYVKTKSVT